MRILFLGQIGPGQTSLMRMRALSRLGHQVRGVHTTEAWAQASWAGRQIQKRTQTGPIINRINAAVLAAAREFSPDLVWAEKQEYLFEETITALKRLGARTVHFTPDPYFTLTWKRTRLMDRAIGAFDVLVYCKAYERAQFKALGKPLIYIPLGYCDEVHRPLASADPRWCCSVGFLGGWEPRREALMHALAASGADLKIWGGYWDFLRDGHWSPRRQIILGQLAGDEPFRIHRDDLLAATYQGGEVYNDDYARALTGSRIGLGLVRRVCPDQHTTRTFEIPACGSLLLADRTEEHLGFFKEGVEAEFFDSTDELIDKAAFYGANEVARARVARAGHERCVSSGYSYVSRMKEALDAVNHN